ncbi:16S rRNA (guanine(966)-N(2))-methyltransferase RsmD [Tenuibacillus multivorans]|uniref:16S rRNA (Guanine966-N2)-methyltransferase n=1 Tax=Tenuibacillus multivorans TaxID=237069 RepID=A0A1G9Y8N4_9BACI|nr:16S rRNA (guanine(966)-N(2))-methyltransferase RsmD [Tenuibacillus multivorans]GEL75990.1 methyltransferase [Tenuibacillus multivorans]SDN05387.1 16S rRNA (guanine966-N2)-methyltransferase [Tenuibacillus multivorans]
MRVIAGKYKGHAIKAVPNHKTRPTIDKVKEALFQMIGPFFDGGRALDLFAGSGGLGFEAISRGMDDVVFVDQQYHAIQTIRENARILDVHNQCQIYRNDAFRAIKAASKRGKTFQYVFLDPPYGKVSFEDLCQALDEFELLENQALIICEHSQDEQLPDSFDRYTMVRREEYSSQTELTIYRYQK